MQNQKRKFGKQFPWGRIAPLAIGAILAVMTAVACHTVAPAHDSVSSWIVSLIYGGVLWIWWAGVVELLWRLGGRWPSTLGISARSAGLHLLAAVGTALIHLGLMQVAVFGIERFADPLEKASYHGLELFDLPRFGIELLLYGLIWFACAAIATQLAAQRNAMRSLELERQLASAQLRTLQMQLEPHFLFNTLNAITSLMELGRTDEALTTLGHLNAILKTVLQRSTPNKIPLAQELEIVESYLAIERVRFHDRLRVDIDLDPAALDGLVPCFLLQPIVENAIRHGIAHRENDGCIEARARRVGPNMQLRVRDNGPGLNGNGHAGFGVGLSNTKERLLYFYKNNHEFRASQPDCGGFEVSITIPYERTAS